MQKVSDNAYVLELPEYLQMSPTFNVADLREYYPPDEGFPLLLDSREFCSQDGSIDVGA